MKKTAKSLLTVKSNIRAGEARQKAGGGRANVVRTSIRAGAKEGQAKSGE